MTKQHLALSIQAERVVFTLRNPQLNTAVLNNYRNFVEIYKSHNVPDQRMANPDDPDVFMSSLKPDVVEVSTADNEILVNMAHLQAYMSLSCQVRIFLPNIHLTGLTAM